MPLLQGFTDYGQQMQDADLIQLAKALKRKSESRRFAPTAERNPGVL